MLPNLSDPPLPFIFNALKHHLPVIRLVIEQVRSDAALAEEAFGLLENVGAPATDIYTGALTVDQIREEIVAQLQQQGRFDLKGYSEWLAGSGRGYRFLDLSDGSRWLFRLGGKPGRYIHFHPAKYSPLSFRVRGSTLKSAVAVMVCFPEVRHFSLEQINRVRQQRLGLSPVKSVAEDRGIGKLLKILQDSDGTL